MSRWIAALFALTLAVPPALAQDESSDEDDDIWALLDDLPARRAWDLAVAISYGNIGYWNGATNPWTGYGVRGTYGGVVNAKHRFGGSFGVAVEGPFPVYMTVAFEPAFAYDYISGRLQLGASVGPSLLYHESRATIRTERHLSLSPMVSARVGYSTSFSRVGRRFFVLLEPRFRYITGGRNLGGVPDYAVSLVVGSGQGR